MRFSVTPAAQKFVRRLLMFDGGPDSGLRLRVSPGGCSQLAAEFDVESNPREGDKLVEVNGLRFFLPAESRLLLEGATIDFVETPTESGLVFQDPKAASCACSTDEAVESIAS